MKLLLARICFSYILTITLMKADNAVNRPKTLKIDRILGKCKAYPKPILYLDNIRINPGNEFNLRLVTVENIDENAKISIIKKRCQNRESLDTCETIPSITGKNFFNFTGMQNQIWTSIVNSFQPQIKSPLLPGAYVLENGKLDESFLQDMPVDNAYWRMEVQISEGEAEKERITGCVQLEGKLMHVQSAKPAGPPKPKPMATTLAPTTTEKPVNKLTLAREKARKRLAAAKAAAVEAAVQVSIPTTESAVYLPKNIESDGILRQSTI